MSQAGVIRSVACGLVLDAGQYEVKLQPHNGSPLQLWILEPVGNGSYFIVNMGNGNVLDIQGGAEEGESIITYERHGGENQRWFIHPDRTIVCAAAGGYLALDVCDGNCTVGAQIIAYTKHGGDNQQFYFQPM